MTYELQRKFWFHAIFRDCWYLYALNPLDKYLSGRLDTEPDQTIEILMTDLDPKVMALFTKNRVKTGPEATKVHVTLFSLLQKKFNPFTKGMFLCLGLWHWSNLTMHEDWWLSIWSMWIFDEWDTKEWIHWLWIGKDSIQSLIFHHKSKSFINLFSGGVHDHSYHPWAWIFLCKLWE